MYEKQLKDINSKKSITQKQAAWTKYGIKSECCLHSSPYFHVSNNDIFDLLHQFPEGVGSLDLKLVIQHYYYSPVYKFDIDVFNKRINTFHYGISEVKNKPSGNFTKDNNFEVKQKGAQTLLLLRVFPFLVSDVA